MSFSKQEREAAKPKPEATEEVEEEIVHDENEWSEYIAFGFVEREQLKLSCHRTEKKLYL